MLARDPMGARTLGLFAELERGRRRPGAIFDHLSAHADRLTELPPATLTQLAETLLTERDAPKPWQDIAVRMLLAATRGLLDARDFRRIAVGLLRAHRHEEALAFLDQQIARHPEWADGWSALQLRGDAMLGFAGRFRHTAGRRDLAAESRRRAWHDFTRHLDDAEPLLRRAMTAAGSPEEVAIVQRNLDYLANQRQGQPPWNRRPAPRH